MAELTKQCTGCGQILPLSMFHVQKTGALGRLSVCASCKLKWHKEHHARRKAAENAERLAAQRPMFTR